LTYLALQQIDIMLTYEIIYKALVDKDVSYEGTFIAAVKTTGIFCRPTCTARKPKKENVEFYSTTKEAILKGYRPCKVCNPLEKLGETPNYIKNILKELNDNPSLKFKDWDLTQQGVEPSKIRRWFLKNHGITFQAYQRMYRINSAFKKIQNLETPLGTMFACAAEQGICLLEFTDRKMLETELKSLAKQLNANIIQGANKHFDLLRRQLDEYFEGKRKEFTIQLFTPGTEFQQSVWKVLQTIPYGSTYSYKLQAIALKKPDAFRAVANANGMNRISIIIPCHRVIGEDGNLIGYGGGLWRKKWLLDLEKQNG